MAFNRQLLEVAERLRWYALKVPPQREFIAQHILEQKGLRTYVPVQRRYRKKNRYAKRKTLNETALHPRYVFAGFEPGEVLWFDLFRIHLIKGVLGVNGEPREIPNGQIVDWIKRLGGGDNASHVQRFMRSNAEFKVGDTVEIIAGPFEGMKVPVEEISGRNAKIFMELFGGKTEVSVPLDVLQAA